MESAASIGDIFITATGMKDILRKEHFLKMKDGAVVCNTGHYNCEVNIDELESISTGKRTVRDNNEEYKLKDNRRIYLLAQGRLVNLAAAEGHPSEVMDMSFANQLLSMITLAQKGKGMKPDVYDITKEQDEHIAKIKLKTMGIELDKLSQEQEKYRTAYAEGT